MDPRSDSHPQQLDQPDQPADPLLDGASHADLAGIGEERYPEQYDTSPRPEDGPQDVDQDPHYEVAETDGNDDDDDPEVHEVA